jgi:hypothetical protein
MKELVRIKMIVIERELSQLNLDKNKLPLIIANFNWED